MAWGTDVWTYGCTGGQNFSPFYRTLSPTGASAQKLGIIAQICPKMPKNAQKWRFFGLRPYLWSIWGQKSTPHQILHISTLENWRKIKYSSPKLPKIAPKISFWAIFWILKIFLIFLRSESDFWANFARDKWKNWHFKSNFWEIFP